MTRIAVAAVTVCLAATAGWGMAEQRPADGEGDDFCTVTAAVKPLAGLPEGSGVALSRRTPNILWAHNDSGQATLVALDTSGAVKGRVQVTGARVVDWEDVSVGPCLQGSCVYIADIGDNNRVRQRVTIYRAPEPQPGDGMTAPVEAFDAIYPDGAHDAEALLVTSADDLFIVTKDADSAALYRFPKPLRAGTAVRLQAAGTIPLPRVTAASVSPDGAWVALRTNDDVVFYATRDLVGGKTGGGRRFALKALKEPQGEGVALGSGGAVYLVGEPGTFARLTCALR